MTKKLLERIKAAGTLEELEALGIGRVVCDISHRGGGLGFKGADIAKLVGVGEECLPRNYGAGCNYLGGGVRGSIFASGYCEDVEGEGKVLIDAIAEACIRAYEHEEGSLNQEEDEEGNINWDAKATNAARKSGVKSAY